MTARRPLRTRTDRPLTFNENMDLHRMTITDPPQPAQRRREALALYKAHRDELLEEMRTVAAGRRPWSQVLQLLRCLDDDPDVLGEAETIRRACIAEQQRIMQRVV